MQSGKFWDPFIVIGVGNCGTSTVARVLHTKLGVFMGYRFRNNHYEDLEFKFYNDCLLDGKCSLLYWQAGVEQLIANRRKMLCHWGFKDPRNAYILGLYLRYFEDPFLILCERKDENILKDMNKNYGWSKTDAKQVLRERKACIDRVILGKVNLQLDFSHQRSDDEIIEAIKNTFSFESINE